MIIIGNGFLARNLRRLADRYPDVVLLASGVAGLNPTEAEYRRERDIVDHALDLARGQNATLVFLSSAAVYGGEGCTGSEHFPPDPPTAYGRHKLGLEHRIASSVVPHLLLRIGYVLGPTVPQHRLVPTLTRGLLAGSVTVHRGSHRDIIDVVDMVRIVELLLDAGIVGETLNVGSGFGVDIERIVDHLEYRLGTVAVREYLDRPSVHRVSLDKLRGLVPGVADLDFEEAYPFRTIDSYLVGVGLVAAENIESPRAMHSRS